MEALVLHESIWHKVFIYSKDISTSDQANPIQSIPVTNGQGGWTDYYY